MNKLDELMALLQKQEKEERKAKNTVMWVLAIIWCRCGSGRYCIRSVPFFHTGYLEDFEDDFDDDFDDYFEDER